MSEIQQINRLSMCGAEILFLNMEQVSERKYENSPCFRCLVEKSDFSFYRKMEECSGCKKK